jgi:hypothetical protein
MSASTYERLAKWASGEAWAERSMEVQQDHLGPAMDACDAESPADLSDYLGPEIAQIVQIVAFEDLLARIWPDGSNLVDDYLKRRGMRETATSRDLLNAYRGTAMSLWEVVEVRNSASLRVQDLVCGGEPVWIDHVDAGLFEPGHHIGARLLRTRRGPRFGLALLPFDPDDTVALRSVLAAHLTEAMEADGCDEVEAGRRALAVAPGLITMGWLADRSEAPESEWEDDETEDEDEDEGPVVGVRWPLKPQTTDRDVRAAFRGLPAIRILTQRTWLLMDLNVSEPDDSGVDHLIGPVVLTETEILVSVLTHERAQEAIALLAPVLEGLVEAPTITANLEPLETTQG